LPPNLLIQIKLSTELYQVNYTLCLLVTKPTHTAKTTNRPLSGKLHLVSPRHQTCLYRLNHRQNLTLYRLNHRQNLTR
jgi:hypothetical protein